MRAGNTLPHSSMQPMAAAQPRRAAAAHTSSPTPGQSCSRTLQTAFTLFPAWLAPLPRAEQPPRHSSWNYAEMSQFLLTQVPRFHLQRALPLFCLQRLNPAKTAVKDTASTWGFAQLKTEKQPNSSEVVNLNIRHWWCSRWSKTEKIHIRSKLYFTLVRINL